MDYQELINKNIKELRQNYNLTQEEFAEKIGISIQGLSNIERNRYQPNAETINKICESFKLSPLELLVPKTNDTQEIVKNITLLLSDCPRSKLKKIYEIVSVLVKM